MSQLLAGMSTLIALQLLGETIAFLGGLPVPGPVIGLVLLLVVLLARGAVPEGLSTCATVLISHLSLLFVPAGVGIVAQMDLVDRRWPLLLAVVTIGTWTTIGVTALVMSRLMPKGVADGEQQ